MKLTKEEFMKVAREILDTDEIIFVGDEFTPEDEMYEETGNKCKIVIRDFDNPRFEKMKESGVWDSDDDREFTDEYVAWSYYQKVEHGRLMDSSGSIFADFEGDEK